MFCPLASVPQSMLLQTCCTRNLSAIPEYAGMDSHTCPLFYLYGLPFCSLGGNLRSQFKAKKNSLQNHLLSGHSLSCTPASGIGSSSYKAWAM